MVQGIINQTLGNLSKKFDFEENVITLDNLKSKIVDQTLIDVITSVDQQNEIDTYPYVAGPLQPMNLFDMEKESDNLEVALENLDQKNRNPN